MDNTEGVDVSGNGVGDSVEGELVSDQATVDRYPQRWKPGQSGNPRGRPPNARIKLTDKFLATMLKVFHEHGLQAVTKVAQTDPATYLRAMVALVPKDYQVLITGDDGAKWVISAAPELTQEEWEAKHDPDRGE